MRKTVVFVYLLLLSIGLQYETSRYTSGDLTGSEYGIVSLSILLALFYILPGLFILYYMSKKWGTSRLSVTLSLLGGLFLAGWTASFANTYLHDVIAAAFPDSGFWNTYESAIVAPLVEEPLKILPLAFALYLAPVKDLRSLLLLGAASGLGFQIVEDFSYILSDLPDGFSYTVSGILYRTTYSISSHWIYTSLMAVGLALMVKKGKKRVSGFAFVLLALATHFVRNTPFSELETDLPFTGPLVSAVTIFSFYLLYQFVVENNKKEI